MDADLITLTPPDARLAPGLIDAPGGFVWWYLDLVTPGGDGLVLIWSFGLPFLPGYASAARRGEAQRPAARPSLNVSLYRGGQLAGYLLQEYAPEQASWQPGASEEAQVWRFGDTRIERRVAQDGTGGRVELVCDLACDLPAGEGRLVGEVRLAGRRRRGCGAEAGGDAEGPQDLPEHDWTPVCAAATGTADLAVGAEPFKLRGRAYHDRNGGRQPLHDLGIADWIWGRLPLEGADLIYYALTPDEGGKPVCLALRVDEDGRTERVEEVRLEANRWRRNVGGLRYPTRLELFSGNQRLVTVRHGNSVDSGPFYMRWLTEGEAYGQTVRGVGELCQPDRIDLDHHRPLVRMRVHRVDADNSMWLPLFCGSRRGRVRRLVSNLIGGGAA